MVVVRCEEISKCFVLPVYTTSCDELRLVVEAAFEKLVPASSLRRLRLLIDGREVPDGNQKLSEAGLGLGKAAVDVILLERIDCGGGDLKCQFKSIIVEQLPSLIEAIKVDFEGWREKIRLETGNYPVYKQRFEGDHLTGREVVWDGYSDSVKYFFEQTGIDPSTVYPSCYSELLRSISTSYVWRATTLITISGLCTRTL
jgi:hypothetical protein